jgi:hypothetical protein
METTERESLLTRLEAMPGFLAVAPCQAGSFFCRATLPRPSYAAYL